MCPFLRLMVLLALCAALDPVQAQYVPRDERGEREAERKVILDANRVGLSIFNYGLSGGVGEVRGNWPIGSDDFYLGDLQLIVGAEVTDDNGETVQIVATSRGPRAGADGPPGQSSVFWGFEAVPSYHSPDGTRWAQSTDPDTWPAVWPDKLGDASDPGWPGAWNGLLGKDAFIDGVELYSHYADNPDQEFDYTPDPEDPERGGLGLVVSQRVLAWSTPLLEDAIVFIYDIYNASPKPLDTAALGFVIGTLSGGDGDTQDDYVAYDFDRDVGYWLDFDDSGNQGQDLGVAGLALLQTPTPVPGGPPQDEIGMTGVFSFTPPGAVRMSNDELLFDILTLEGANDADIDQCFDEGGCDGDLILSAGPFELPTFSSQRVVAALVFGDTVSDTESLIDVLRVFVRNYTAAAADDAVPTAHRIGAPFPNPARGLTTVAYDLKEAGRVKLVLYDVLGREVAALVEAEQPAGPHTAQFDASRLASGVYVLRLEHDGQVRSQRLTVVR